MNGEYNEELKMVNSQWRVANTYRGIKKPSHFLKRLYINKLLKIILQIK